MSRVDDQFLGRPLGPVLGCVGGVDEGADDDGLTPLREAPSYDLLVEAFGPAHAVDADQPILASVVDAAALEQAKHRFAEVVGDLGVGRQSAGEHHVLHVSLLDIRSRRGADLANPASPGNSLPPLLLTAAVAHAILGLIDIAEPAMRSYIGSY